jgi:hypothetical protein
MKKIFLFVIASVFISLSSQAQCLPIPPSMNEGAYPDTLSHACANYLYYDTTVVVFLLDTTLNIPPFGVITIPADSIIIDSIIGVPAGITTTQSSPGAAYPGGSTIPAMQCIEFVGIPISPQATTEIKLYCTYYATVPFVGVQSFPDTLSLYLSVGQNGSSSIINTTACDFYTSPSGLSTWYSSGTYADTIANNEGCDSIITINLTITEIDSTVVQNGDTLFAVDTADSYQWYNCDSNFTALAGETNSYFSFTSSGDYALVLEKNGCYDTSACISVVYTTSNALTSNDIQIFPNPTQDYSTIKFNTVQEEVKLEIRNHLGQLISSETYYNCSSIQVYLPKSQGIYFIQMQTSDSPPSFYKIIKNQ